MTQAELLNVLKEVAEVDAADPAVAKQSGNLCARLDPSLTLDSPLAQVGWDSLEMTWVLVRLEERLDIDTSNLSMFNLHTVGDLLRELKQLTDARAAANG